MIGYRYPPLAKAMKPKVEIAVRVCRLAEIPSLIEKMMNESDEDKWMFQALTIAPDSSAYAVVFQRLVMIPMTPEEEAAQKEKWEAMNAAALEERAKQGPPRYEVDTAKVMLHFIIQSLPGGECEKEQRLERISEALESCGDAIGPLAAYQQALKELREGNEPTWELEPKGDE